MIFRPFSASNSTFTVTSRYPSSASKSEHKNLFLIRQTVRPVWLCVSTNKRTVCSPTVRQRVHTRYNELR
jgi:hypothetical protein